MCMWYIGTHKQACGFRDKCVLGVCSGLCVGVHVGCVSAREFRSLFDTCVPDAPACVSYGSKEGRDMESKAGGVSVRERYTYTKSLFVCVCAGSCRYCGHEQSIFGKGQARTAVDTQNSKQVGIGPFPATFLSLLKNDK